MSTAPHAAATRRWCFADQLGPHFLDHENQTVLLVESTRAFGRRRFHRQKAHLLLSALRHRAVELGDRARFLRSGTYREAVDTVDEPLSVCGPTSRGADRLVHTLDLEVLPARGFVTSRRDFATWAEGRRGRLLMEDFYRDTRRRLGVLMNGDEPAGGRWNFDADNRERPPKRSGSLAVSEPWWPTEDDIDAEVRADLDRMEREGRASFVGRDGPRRFAATRTEALAALDAFIAGRLAAFGPYEDAMLAADWTMAHSMLSAPMNLGLLHPLECVERAEHAYLSGEAPLNSVEGYVRQLIGWRDYVWHIYWHTGPEYREGNALDAHAPVPPWWADLNADAVEARCLSTTLAQLRDTGWVHHIPRLMILGSWALQRGINPSALTDWFHESFVDGYEWVMAPNVIGMSQHADGGLMATKPYTSGGAYINTMSDFCAECRYKPTVRVGDEACPYSAGYWAFLDRNRSRLSNNPRMRRSLIGLDRLRDLDGVREQEHRRGTAPP